jgi:hypothetical protein
MHVKAWMKKKRNETKGGGGGQGNRKKAFSFLHTGSGCFV